MTYVISPYVPVDAPGGSGFAPALSGFCGFTDRTGYANLGNTMEAFMMLAECNPTPEQLSAIQADGRFYVITESSTIEDCEAWLIAQGADPEKVDAAKNRFGWLFNE